MKQKLENNLIFSYKCKILKRLNIYYMKLGSRRQHRIQENILLAKTYSCQGNDWKEGSSHFVAQTSCCWSDSVHWHKACNSPPLPTDLSYYFSGSWTRNVAQLDKEGPLPLKVHHQGLRQWHETWLVCLPGVLPHIYWVSACSCEVPSLCSWVQVVPSQLIVFCISAL